jgi:hypothetical protein
MLFVISVASPRLKPLQAAGIVFGATGVFIAATMVVQAAFRLVGLAPDSSTHYLAAVSEPGRLLWLRLAGIDTPQRVLSLLPNWSQVRLMALTFQPLVLVAGLFGLALLPPRARWLGVVAVASTAFTTTLYAAPWTAMSAYPLIYTGAGVTFARLGALAAGMAAAIWRSSAGAFSLWTGRAVSVALASLAVAATNRDLLGDARFVLLFWDQYGPRPLF